MKQKTTQPKNNCRVMLCPARAPGLPKACLVNESLIGECFQINCTDLHDVWLNAFGCTAVYEIIRFEISFAFSLTF